MSYQTTFKRYEIKYLIDKNQKEKILNAMQNRMKPDEFGEATIRNIYYDTQNYMLIRHSLEKPIYKEKFRLRSYKKVGADDPIFLELKKKYKSVVYKRRLVLPASQIEANLEQNLINNNTQIAKEITYFLNHYETLHPVVFLSYDRQAYHSTNFDFRITFDENIIYRDYDLSLSSDIYGEDLIGKNQTLMEIKTSGGLPLWITGILTENKLFKTSFSKYGEAYKRILRNERGEICA